MSTTIIERVADLREQAKKTRQVIETVKLHGGQCATLSLMVADLEEVASQAIETSLRAMYRLEQIAKESLEP